MDSVIYVGDEAFQAHEIGGRHVRLCTRCNVPYGTGDYAAHCDAFHIEGRTPYWRQRSRITSRRGTEGSPESA